jgi:hypothetical protein
MADVPTFGGYYGGYARVHTGVNYRRDSSRIPPYGSSSASRHKRDGVLGEQEPQEQSVEYQLPPELASGVYANYAVVHHETEHDMIIDFCQLDSVPPGPGGTRVVRVVSRVHVARSFVTPLLQAISTGAFQQEEAIRQLGEGEPSGP